MRSNKAKLAAVSLLLVTYLHLAGFFDLLRETPYANFAYPLEVNASELLTLAEQGRRPPYVALNPYDQYHFRIPNERKCRGSNSSAFVPVTLVMMVKSGLTHRERRNVIRRTWGLEDRFPGVSFRRIFVVGVSPDDPTVDDSLDEEYARHGDLVQAEFVDTYYNLTLKTMTGFRWLTEYCPNAEFVFFVDDDYYVSPKNLLAFLRNSGEFRTPPKGDEDAEGQCQHLRPNDRRLWAGLVFADSRPERIRWSKWYTSVAQYPFSKYPPYALGGAYVLSFSAVRDLYRMAQYTLQFHLEDVFLGIVALKLQFGPCHSDAFLFHTKPSVRSDFVGVVAAHGFPDPDDLVSVWEEQSSYGQV